MLAALRENSGSVERHQLRRRHNEMPRRRNTRQTCWSLTRPAPRPAVEPSRSPVRKAACRPAFAECVFRCQRRIAAACRVAFHPPDRPVVGQRSAYATSTLVRPACPTGRRSPVRHPLRRQQNDPGSVRRTALALVRASPALQRPAFPSTESDTRGLAMPHCLIHTVIYDSKH